MIVLTVNSGSTSVKLGAFDAQGQLLRRERAQPGDDPGTVLARLRATLSAAPTLIVHRVVHGGARFAQPTRLDAAALAHLEQLDALAPLHNPRARAWIAAAQAVFPGSEQAAAFDTAFFHDLPQVAAQYALPERVRSLGVRRYGFHGLAHQAMWRRFSRLNPQLADGGRLITLQLGGGCSMAAIAAGRPLDTSMGFSPLEGLVMATRCGDLDPALVPWLAQQLGVDGAGVLAMLNRESGLAGLAGGESSAGALARREDAAAQFALELYCYRIRKYLGAYLAVLGGADGIVFGGGVGEHVPEVRARILTGMDWAGVVLDAAANAGATGAQARIDAPASSVRIQVIPVDEEQVLLEAGRALLA